MPLRRLTRARSEGTIAGVCAGIANYFDVDVVLVSRENYLVFQPMLPEVISGSIGLTDVVSPIRRLVKRTQLHMRDVEAIDLERRLVVANPGFRPQPHLIPYDHLVLALGSVTDFRGMRGLAEHAFPFKNLVDALNRLTRETGAEAPVSEACRRQKCEEEAGESRGAEARQENSETG